MPQSRKKEENILKETIELVQYTWLHRKGNEAKAAVIDTLMHLYPKEPRPIIPRKAAHKRECPECKDGYETHEHGWTFIFHLPPGCLYSKFKEYEVYFSDATGGIVTIERHGKGAKMTVSNEHIKKQYPWMFKPDHYLEKMYLPIHFGHSGIGEIVKDLADFPNILVAGHPGSGKSVWLQGVCYNVLMTNASPDAKIGAVLAVIDLKLLEFAYLKPWAAVVSEIEDARKLLQQMNNELTRRLPILEAAKCRKLQDYIKKGHKDLPFIVLVIDELAEMKDEECQQLLNRICRLGRAAGFCVITATQRPSSTMFKAFGDTKALFPGSVCFHVRGAVDSEMVIGSNEAAYIPNNPGRAIYQWDKKLEVQTEFLDCDKAEEELERRAIQLPTEQKVMLLGGSNQSSKGLPPR